MASASGSFGQLSVNLLLQTAEWIAGLSKAEYEAAKQADKIAATFDSMGKKITGSLKAGAAGLVAGFGAKELEEKLAAATEFADRIGQLAAKVGNSVEQMSALSVYAGMAGTSIEAVSGSLAKFNQSLVAAQKPSTQQREIFDALGVAVKDAQGNLRSAADVSKDTMIALGSLEDGAVKTALAIKLFGKSGAELIPIMNTMARQSEDLRQATKAYGDAVAALAPAASALADQQAIFTTNQKTLWTQIATQVVPWFTKLLEQWNEMTKAGPALSNGLQVVINIFKGLVIAIDGVVTATVVFVKGVVAAVQAFAALKNGDSQGALAIIKDFGQSAKDSGGAMLERWASLAAPLDNVAESAFKAKQTTDAMAKSAADASGKLKTIEAPKFYTTDYAAQIKKFDTFAVEVLHNTNEMNNAFYGVAFTIEKATRELGMNAMETERARLQQELLNAAITKFGSLQAALADPKYIEQVKRLNDAIDAQGLKKFTIAADEQIRQLKVQAATLGMSAQEAERYAAQQALLNEATKDGAKLTPEYTEKLKELNEQFDSRQRRQDFLDFMNTMEGAWHEAWGAMFDSTKGGWQGMLDSLKASFKKMLVEYVYSAFAKPIFLNFVAGMFGQQAPGSLTGMSGTNNFLSSLFSGGSGGGFSLDNVSSMWNAASNWWSGGSAAEMPGYASEMWGASAGPGYAAESGAAGGFGSMASTAGYGLAGGVGGYLVAKGYGAGNRGVQNATNYGALGASAGSAFGPIGAVAGWALGTIIGISTDPDPDAMRKGSFGTVKNQPGTSADWTRTSALGTFGLSDTHWFSGKEMGDQLNAFLDQIKGMDNAIAASLKPEEVEKLKARLDAFVKSYEFGMEHMDITGLGDIVKDRLKVITDEVAPELSKFVDAFTGDANDLVTAVEGYLQLRNAQDFKAGDVATQFEDQQKQADSQMESYQAQKGALDDLISSYDGSAQSTTDLVTSLGAFQQATVAMIVAIDQAAAAMHAMFEDTAKSIRMSTMTPEEKYAYLQQETQDLYAQLATETDPAKIQQLSQRINNDINEAWGLLSDDQKKALQADFLTRLDALDEAVANKMTALRDVVAGDSDSVMTAVTDKLHDVFQMADAAATTQNEAADKNLQAANTPITVHVVDDRLVTSAG